MKLPAKKNYSAFIREFSEELTEKHSDVCFYIYGSYTDKRADYGRSDIDGGLILNADFVTNKGQIMDLAKILKNQVIRYEVETQFNLIDRGSARDGRFLSYTKDYTDWIIKMREVICGPDYVDEMKGFDFKSGVLQAATFNFRRIRNNLLESLIDLSKNPKKFNRELKKATEALVSLSRKIIYLEDGEIRGPRGECIRIIKERYPKLDLTTMEKINDLFRKPREFMGIIFGKNVDLQFSIYQQVLTAYEEMIKAYVKKFPDVSKKEVRN
jgi:hypothetical protein